MTLVLNLPPELEDELVAEAARMGIPITEYALRILAGHGSQPLPHNGQELLAYWQSEGVIGAPRLDAPDAPDVPDAVQHARVLRERAQRRTGQ